MAKARQSKAASIGSRRVTSRASRKADKSTFGGWNDWQNLLNAVGRIDHNVGALLSNTTPVSRSLSTLAASLNSISGKLDTLTKQAADAGQERGQAVATLEDIKTAVAQENDVVQSVVKLLGDLHTALQDAIATNDPAAIQAVVDSINAEKQALADAAAANTVAAPAA